MKTLSVILGLLSFAFSGHAVIDVTFEAFQPKGFRVYIPDEPGMKLFAFQGQLNTEFNASMIGQFSCNIKESTDGFWVYENSEVTLEIGDVMHYWVIIQQYQKAYRKTGHWMVVEYKRKQPLNCIPSETVVDGENRVCKGRIIFEDDFTSIDQSKWVIEHYIPNRGPSFEFNTYENSPDTVCVKNHNLRIKPIPKIFAHETRGELDLRLLCTRRKYSEECFHQHHGAQILHPVRSGKIRSKFSFLYGKIEVRAKLPAGDWIFPEISLIPAEEFDGTNTSKIWIAYARGNEHLIGNAKDDIGGTILFAGEVLTPFEPSRSSRLVSIRDDEAYTKRKHLYTLIWEPGRITSYVDNILIGQNNITSAIGKSILSLGVGVGGITDFPDDYMSGTTRKPWRNNDLKRMRTFFDARSEWLTTWHHPDTELQVDYVKIYAL